MVGIALADSISIMERTSRIAEMMGSADVIIESAVVLTQEIHDGPFETYTGHGIWSNWEGSPTYSLEGKTLIRIDLDPNLKKAWDFENSSGAVQQAIDHQISIALLIVLALSKIATTSFSVGSGGSGGSPGACTRRAMATPAWSSRF